MLSTCSGFPCIDAPHAPLADAFEVDDFLFDTDSEQCYNMQTVSSINGEFGQEHAAYFSSLKKL